MMKMHSVAQVSLLVSLLVPVLCVLAVEKDAAVEIQNSATVPAVETATWEKQPVNANLKRLVYAPPRRGAPLTRVGGSARNTDDPKPGVVVIAPEHTGLTANPQPALYWYLSKSTGTRFEFALVNDLKVDPILHIISDGDMPAGFNHIDLAERGITLEPGVEYKWSVVLVQDPGQRSVDIVSSGHIEYVTPPAALQAELENAPPVEALRILAGAGYWYDTFAQLSEWIATDPGNSTLREERDALLKQVGLADLASQ
jgi:hypothetical protein